MSKPSHEMPLGEMDIAVANEFAYTEEWDRLENDAIARDVFLAIGSGHLRGPEFYEDAFRFSEYVRRPGRACQHCGKVPELETAQDLLDALRRSCFDEAMKNPWCPQSRLGHFPWGRPAPESVKREEICRELRLRELLVMVRCGIAEAAGFEMGALKKPHVKYHILPAPPEPEPIIHYEI